MSDQEEEGLLDLGKSPHRTKGRGLTLRERVRTARRFPQAVVKVTSFGKGVKEVMKHLRYITREGTLALEKDTGEILKDEELQKDLVEAWSIDFDTRKNSRDTANIVFSMPRGSDPEALRKAVRATGARAFLDNEWVFAVHEDRQHPHSHMVVLMRGREQGKKLQLRKADLYRLREIFAEAAREQGVMLAASPRAARGIGSKGVRQTVYHLRKKGTIPQVERDAAKEALVEFRLGNKRTKPWEAAMAKRNQLERARYAQHAEYLRGEAGGCSGIDRERLLQAAVELEEFAKSLPIPKTRRQTLMERAAGKSADKQAGKDRIRSPGPELEK